MADPISGYTLAQNNVDLSNTSQSGTISYANATNVKPLSEYVNGNASITNQSTSSSPAALGNGPLRYPNAQLDSTSDWLEIKIVQYKAPGFNAQPGTVKFATGTSSVRNKESGSIKNPIQYIHLPIPKQLSDSNSIDWGNGDTLNPLMGMGTAAVEGLIKNPGDITKIISNAYNTAVNSTKTSEGQKAGLAAASQFALNNLGANVSASSILSRSTGTAINPNLELLFNGVSLRQFEFTFEFAPRDAYESGIVRQIIRAFKKSMSAKTTSSASGSVGLLIAAPDVFEIRYKSGNKDHPFLNAFKTCALLNISLDYTASGNYSTYSDGTPVHMSMTLSFKELNPIYAEDYDTEEAGPGVGY